MAGALIAPVDQSQGEAEWGGRGHEREGRNKSAVGEGWGRAGVVPKGGAGQVRCRRRVGPGGALASGGGGGAAGGGGGGGPAGVLASVGGVGDAAGEEGGGDGDGAEVLPGREGVGVEEDDVSGVAGRHGAPAVGARGQGLGGCEALGRRP